MGIFPGHASGVEQTEEVQTDAVASLTTEIETRTRAPFQENKAAGKGKMSEDFKWAECRFPYHIWIMQAGFLRPGLWLQFFFF